MSITTRILAIAVAALLLLGVGEGVWLHYSLKATAAAEQRADAAELDVRSTNAAFTAYKKATAKLAKKNAAAQRKLDDALASNPSWRDAPVPDDVYDSLFPAAGKASAASGVSEGLQAR